MCTERYVNPFTDFGFKLMFGTPANKEFLISFLNSLFDEEDKITEISYSNVEQLGQTAGDRAAVFDLYCTTVSGAHIIVEMQNVYQRYFIDRTIFYSSFPMQEVAKKGEWDYRLPRIYTVSFLNFRMPQFVDTPQYKHVVKLTDVESKEVFYDKLTYYYLELPKFDKEIDDLHGYFDQWLYVIKNINQLNERPAALREKVFETFFAEAEIANFRPEQRVAYELSLKSMRDYNNTLRDAKILAREEGLKEGREEGKALGREEGQEMAKIEIAKNMLAMGLDISSVASATGLTEEQIKAISL